MDGVLIISQEMSFNKIYSFIIIVLLIALGIFVFLYRQEHADRLSEANKYANEKKKALREERDKRIFQVDSLTQVLDRTIQDLRYEEQNIKYKPYEKLRYTDRNVDAALDTISKYNFNSSSRN
jgi:uncharacterized membrane protein